MRGQSIACLLALLLAQLDAAYAEQRFDGVTLRVATYGGNWRQTMERELTPRFAALGGKLEIIAGTPQANFAKLIAGRGRAPFDIMDILDSQVPGFLESDMLAPLDPERLPNIKDLRPGSVNSKMVSAWTSQGVICFNSEKFKAIGLAPPKTYTDLVQPKLAGKTMVPDLNAGAGIPNIGAIVFAAGGDETHLEPGLALIRKMTGVRTWTQGAQLVLGFQSGDILAAVSNSGWCITARHAGIPVRAVAPVIRDGVVGVENHGWLGVLKTSTNRDAAYWFLNEYLGVKYQLAYALDNGLTPDNLIAMAKMREDPILGEMIQLDPLALEHQLHLDYAKIDISAWTDAWNHAMVQRSSD